MGWNLAFHTSWKAKFELIRFPVYLIKLSLLFAIFQISKEMFLNDGGD